MNHFSNAQEERNWAMFCHLSALSMCIIPFGNIIGPLVLWSMKKDYSALVDREGKKAINFQLSWTIYMFVSAIMIILVVGIFFLIALALLNLVVILYATIKTINNEDFEYPLSIQFLK